MSRVAFLIFLIKLIMGVILRTSITRWQAESLLDARDERMTRPAATVEGQKQRHWGSRSDSVAR